MASTVATDRPRVGAHRAAERPNHSPERRRFAMVAACYVGLVLIVVVAIALREILPTALGVGLFLTLCAALILTLHPKITFRR